MTLKIKTRFLVSAILLAGSILASIAGAQEAAEPTEAEARLAARRQGMVAKIWWNQPTKVEEIKLSADQRARMDSVLLAFLQGRDTGTAARSALEALGEAIGRGDEKAAHDHGDAFAEATALPVREQVEMMIDVGAMLTPGAAPGAHQTLPQDLLPTVDSLGEPARPAGGQFSGTKSWRRRISMSRLTRRPLPFLAVALTLCCVSVAPVGAQHSVARQWNDELLDAIRSDLTRPTVHARNLFHVSAAMWDAWAAYDSVAAAWLHDEDATAADVMAAREEAISYAAYRILVHRFTNSVGAATSLPSFDARMQTLGFDTAVTTTAGDSPAALGNRVAQAYIQFGLSDGANEANDYENLFYTPLNPPLVPPLPGNPDIVDPNRWQPLALDFFVDQGGNVIPGGFPDFLSPEWGSVVPFCLTAADLTIYQRGGDEYWVYNDLGPPPYHGTATDGLYKAGFEQVVEWSGLLDPTDGQTIEISPASRGNNTLGTNDGSGYAVNPVTGLPYVPQVVPAGDYYRILAEFWADGPDSETPPGHWFTIANYVSDHPLLTKQIGEGPGPVVDDLQWDVKVYLTLGGAMHDVAIAAWGVKGWYDYIRPISAIRFLCGPRPELRPARCVLRSGWHQPPPRLDRAGHSGFRSCPVRAATSTSLDVADENLGKIAVYAWRGPTTSSSIPTSTRTPASAGSWPRTGGRISARAS